MTGGPDISVIIATRNRCESLQETLEDLRQQTIEGEATYEVLVVDNHSTDDTRPTVERIARAYPVALRYLVEERRGRVFALNRGLSGATGAIIAFTDDDVRLGRAWIATISRTFRAYHADGIGGPVRPLWIGERPRWLQDRFVRQLGVVDHGADVFQVTDESAGFIGPNSAWKRSLFASLGGFDEGRVNNSEDVEWFLRVFRAGHTLIYQPEMALSHKIDPARWTKRALARRFFRQGRACALGLQERGTDRAVCRVPLWVVRFYLGLHWQALRCRMRGEADEALWHWLRRYYYLGAIVYCFKDWLTRQPTHRPRPVVVQIEFGDTIPISR